MFLVEVIPPILLGSVAGVFVDRWDRRWTMIGANVVRGLLLLPLLIFSSAEQIWIVYAVAFLESVVNLFFGPANNALLPQLVKEDELVTANSLDALGENVARIIGPAIGGALLAAVGLGAVAITDVASYLIGGVLIFFIQAPQEAREASNDLSGRNGPDSGRIGWPACVWCCSIVRYPSPSSQLGLRSLAMPFSVSC
jgi:predicted MFS family arabinose efflux permease